MQKFLKVVSVLTLLIFLRTGFALASEQVYFYYTDPAGTPLAVSDANATVVWRAHYLPFGEETIDLSTVQNNKMFVGKEKDAESGLYYFDARYMDPTTGRFGSPDSVGPVDAQTGKINQEVLYEPQRLNIYAYGLNNPYKYVDPDGRKSIVGYIIQLTEIGCRKIAVLTSKEAAVMARKQSKNVIMKNRQLAHEVESAAAEGEKVIKHQGHKLPDGSTGLPHYQTPDIEGHAFWGELTGLAAFAGSLIDPSDAISGEVSSGEGDEMFYFDKETGQYVDETANQHTNNANENNKSN